VNIISSLFSTIFTLLKKDVICTDCFHGSCTDAAPMGHTDLRCTYPDSGNALFSSGNSGVCPSEVTMQIDIIPAASIINPKILIVFLVLFFI